MPPKQKIGFAYSIGVTAKLNLHLNYENSLLALLLRFFFFMPGFYFCPD
jgi:hypothetical protein